MKKISTLNEYQDLLNQSGVHVIKVSASWCNPCRTLASRINDLSDSIKNLFVEIDVDEAEDQLLDILKVRNVPVLIFYNGAKEADRLVGAQTKDAILSILEDTTNLN